MEGNATTDSAKIKDELESKKAQEVIGLLLSKHDDTKEVLQNVSYSAVEKIIQDAAAQSSAVTVSLAGSTNLNICNVSLTEAGMLLEAGDIIQHSLDVGTSSIHLEDGCTLIQNYEAIDESDSSDATAKFIDGQAVQLEDGTTAFIHAAPREGLQPVQLEDGTMAYLSQSGGELFNGEASSLDLENIGNSQISDGEGKEYEDKSREIYAVTIESSKRLEKAFRCPYEDCRRLYTTYHHLKVHERSHTGDRPFKCMIGECGKAFATGYGLKSHTRIHTGETPYKCPEEFCNKAFKTSGDLQKHVRTHTGERPFKCPYGGCDRAFTTSNIRKVHIRTHTGERPYVCKEEGCSRAFASATNYKNHIRIHTGEKPYVCSVTGCNKRFTEYSSLYKHHVVHTHSKPYICNRCGKTYRQISTLASHKRTVHGVVEPHLDEDTEEPSEMEEMDISSKNENSAPKEMIELKVPPKSANEVNPSSDASTVSSTGPTIVSVQGGNVTQILHEHPVYAVQVQEDDGILSSLSSLQQIVLVTDPSQLAALQELASQGQLESVLTISEQNPSSRKS